MASINVESTEENRRAYRELLFGSEGIENYISGVILFEETLYQNMADGTPFVDVLKSKGIIPGIKVDKGLKPIPGTDELVTQGLTDLGDRCKRYYEQGARFAKWRAVYRIGPNKPSQLAIESQSSGLAKYAAICQANGLVPIVEPEVLIDGDHSIERCAYVSEKVWSCVVKHLNENNILFEGMLLKPNMVLPGAESGEKATPKKVAWYTVRTLRRTIPAAVPGITFLSGGQSEEEATLNLNAMNSLPSSVRPWSLSFSYGRALQASCLKAWGGKKENVEGARKVFLQRAKANSEAQEGKYGGSGEESERLYQKDYTY